MESAVYSVAITQVNGVQINIVLVNYDSISMNDVAARSMLALKPYFPVGELALAAADIAGVPQFVGPRHLVDYFKGYTLQQFAWQSVVIG